MQRHTPLVLEPASLGSAGVRRLGLAILASLVISLAGCSATVVTQVGEFDANEIVGLLINYGVAAKKMQGADQNFDVVVPEEDLGRALTLLVDAGLPREKSESLGQLFKREGMVSTATEEHIRYVHGLSRELEHTISSIDGVASARVHVVIPQPDLYSSVRRPSSASVLIRYRKPADPAAFGPLVRSLIVRAVEGLEPEQVAVALAPITVIGASLPQYDSVLGLRVAPDSAQPFVALLFAPWLALLALVMWWRRTGVGKALRGMGTFCLDHMPFRKRVVPGYGANPKPSSRSHDGA